ncbi:MAG: DUF2807 domain-containing protein [Defluviitaleaceae bacterium]|nr:DUF2807 domain-containing protein [Defluviitaleaceae bacterium]
MKKFFCTAILLLVATLFLSGCIRDSRRIIRGEGPLMAFTLDFTDFNGLNLSGAHDLTFRQADAFSVVLEIQENLYEILDARVRNGVLEIDYTRSFTTSGRNTTPRLTIYAPTLNSLHVSGAVNADIILDTDSLTVNISGAANLSLEGTANVLNLSVAGAANVDAFEMRAVDATVSVAGTGQVDVYASNTLDISIAGVGRVRYDGDATVTRSTAGLGSIRRR